MAGAMRKMAVYLGLVEDQGDDAYDEYDEYDSARRSAREPRSGGRGYDDRPEERHDDRYTSRSVRPIADTRAVRTFRSDSAPPTRPTSAPLADRPDRRPAYAPAPDLTRIETIHPRSYNDARKIGEDYREGVPVIMNLSELEDADAKRIIDFAAGLVFGMRGSIERITNKVFLLSPVNVDVGDEARAQIAKDGFFNQS
ncbi:MAG: cell division protein SepF [Actinobacteria bacterium]|jgi:cell division inhibitor SepF|nr:cell division protein SepF [Actinomycetota bacterium]